MINLFKTNKEFKELNGDEFKEQIKQKEAVLIDVRTPAEFESGHLPHAKNIDLTDSDFQKRIRDFSKDQRLLLYCRTGSRSAVAAKLLTRKGYTDVAHLKNGIMSWDGPVVS